MSFLVVQHYNQYSITGAFTSPYEKVFFLEKKWESKLFSWYAGSLVNGCWKSP